MSSDEVSINNNKLDKKEQIKVQKQLEDAIKQLKEDPDKFLSQLKPFTI